MMMTRISESIQRNGWHRLLAALLLCGLPGVLLAQDVAPGAGDPPARVARLSYVAGDLGLLPAGAKDWSDAQINRPLTSGDRLSSGNDARAELQLGGASLRMAANTDVGFLALDEQLAQVELTQGTLNISVRDVAAGQSYEIDTPTVALVLDRPGVYRVDVGTDGKSTSVTAFQGDATAYGENNAEQLLHAGNHYTFDDSALADVNITDIRGEDAFDYWSANRDSEYAHSVSQQYVSNDVVGADDLDQYGQWQDNAEYGNVWYPDDVGADWAPYQDGQWSYIQPWGWTWIDAAPWGYAPFHYGRWAYVGSRWGWIPGPRGVRAVFAPALVAFIGRGGFNVSIGVGAPIGWFPLGPGDIYHPWYRSSRGYYTRVNRSDMRGRGRHHKRDLHERLEREYGVYQKPQKLRHIYYLNRHAPHANTVVSAKAFAGGKSIRAARLRGAHLDVARLRTAPVSNAADVKPDRSAHAHRDPAARALPVAGFRRAVIARHAPTNRAARLRTVDQPMHPVTTFGDRPPNVRIPGRVGAAKSPSPSPAADVPVNVQTRTSASRASRASRPILSGEARLLPSVPKLRASDNGLRSSRFAHPTRQGAAIDRIRSADTARNRNGNTTQSPGVSLVGPSNDRANATQRTPRTERLPDVQRLRPASPARVSPASAIHRASDEPFTAARAARATMANPLTHRQAQPRPQQPTPMRQRARQPAPERVSPPPRDFSVHTPARRFNPPPQPAPRMHTEQSQTRVFQPPPRSVSAPRAAPAKASKSSVPDDKSDDSGKRRRFQHH